MGRRIADRNHHVSDRAHESGTIPIALADVGGGVKRWIVGYRDEHSDSGHRSVVPPHWSAGRRQSREEQLQPRRARLYHARPIRFTSSRPPEEPSTASWMAFPAASVHKSAMTYPLCR